MILEKEEFEEVTLNLDKPKLVLVATFKAKVSRLEGEKIFAIVMNAKSFEEATDIDYFITKVEASKVTANWVVMTYSQRNWAKPPLSNLNAFKLGRRWKFSPERLRGG